MGLALEFDIWTVRLAKMPGEMTLSLSPNTIQVSVPTPFVQSIDLPAALADAPTVAFTEVAFEGNPIMNPNAEGSAPLLPENETGSVATLPRVPEVEPRLISTFCAARGKANKNSVIGMKRYGISKKRYGIPKEIGTVLVVE